MTTHLQKIEDALRNFRVLNPNQLLSDPRTLAFLKRAREKILASDAFDAKTMNHAIATAPEDLKLLDGVMPEGLPEDQKVVFANWVIGFDASREYKKTLDQLGVSPDIAVEDMNNPRATAVLIYDHPSIAPKFRDASYSSPGVYFNWEADSQRPLHRP